MFFMTLAVMLFATVSNAKVNGTEDEAKTPDGVEAVDLGLSVKWANMNVGATKDSGFGSYFAWGETKPKKYYSWGTYAWSRDDTQFLVKYNISGVCPPWKSMRSWSIPITANGNGPTRMVLTAIR